MNYRARKRIEVSAPGGDEKKQNSTLNEPPDTTPAPLPVGNESLFSAAADYHFFF